MTEQSPNSNKSSTLTGGVQPNQWNSLGYMSVRVIKIERQRDQTSETQVSGYMFENVRALAALNYFS